MALSELVVVGSQSKLGVLIPCLVVRLYYVTNVLLINVEQYQVWFPPVACQSSTASLTRHRTLQALAYMGVTETRFPVTCLSAAP